MGSHEGTERHPCQPLPVRTLRVEVTEGPDAGVSRETDTDSLSVGTAEDNGLALTDPTVSRYHVELFRADDGVRIVDHGSTNGTAIGPVRVERAVVPAGTVLRLGRTCVRVADGTSRTVEIVAGDEFAGLRGRSTAMRRLFARIEQAARATTPVLLLGESGTGKERIARALHDLGPRAGRAFVTVDCGSLPSTLIASELFGHERGAFTGADRLHVGAFERARGGTLFLDEIGDLPQPLQPALLGALERRRFRRLGGESDVTLDARVVCATNQDLHAEVNAGRFRLDLYYRIAVVVFRVPPLRERPEDIPILVEHFLREAGYDGPAEAIVSPAVMDTLRAHPWPGNVRELRNVIEATVAMQEAPTLDPGGRPGAPLGPAPDAEAPEDPITALLSLPYREARAALLARFETRYLRHALDRAKGNVSRVAREARIDRSHLIELIRRHDLK